MKSRRLLKSVAIILGVFSCSMLHRASLAEEAPMPVGGDVLDNAAFAQWVDGREFPIAEAAAKGGGRRIAMDCGGAFGGRLCV